MSSHGTDSGLTQSGHEGRVESFAGPTLSDRVQRPIDLVFRTVGERTSDVALEWAQHNVRCNAIVPGVAG